nr:hypothetical protein [Tanacetum cinerariifolium]
WDSEDSERCWILQRTVIYKPTNNNLRTSSNSKNNNVDTTLRYKNDDDSGQFGTQRTVNVAGTKEKVGSQPKRVKDSAYHKEKMLLCKQAEQELEAHYSNMAKIQEVPNADSGTDSEPVEQNDQNDVESDDERVALANLIANLKLKVDENKKIQKQLKKANTTLAQELKECEAILAETSKSLRSLLVSEIVAWLHFRPSRLSLRSISRLMTVPLTMTNLNGDSLKFVHELKQEMHADLKYVESLEKEIDELKSEKAEFSDMYDVILHDCVSKDVMCSYLQSLSDLDALAELQCMYLHKVKECDCLAQKLSKQTESVSKKVHTELLQRFAKLEKHLISIEIALQKYLKAQMQDKNIAISELKKLIEKGKGKYVDTKFDRPSVVRQPNAQRIPKPSVLAKKAVSNTNVHRPGMYRIDNRKTHTRAPQLPKNVRNTNLRVSTSTGVNHKSNVSRPQLKSNQSRDKVLPNNSQMEVKNTQVEVHPRIPSVSNKMKSVTACKDSLNSRT